MQLIQLITGFIIFALPQVAAYLDPKSQPENIDPLISGFGNFVSWFRSHGGTIDDRVIIGYEPGTKIRGMIATALIPAGTLLVNTPVSLVLSHPSSDQCLIIAEILKELKAGTQSKWHDYFEFDDSSGSRLPTQWNRGNGPWKAMTELQGLPPAGRTHSHVDWYQRTCKNGKEMTDLDWKALIILVTRASDVGLVPMYDLLNHHNGLINTKLEYDTERGLSIIARSDIPAGAAIYNTYAYSGMESTVDIFNTYGFVEDYPQLWRWTDYTIKSYNRRRRKANRRYGTGNSDVNNHHGEPLQYQPNTHDHEVLVISPTLAALYPTKQLVQTLGSAQRSLGEWQMLIIDHHANIHASHAKALGNCAMVMLNELPTDIEGDEVQVKDERRRLEEVKKVGRVDVNEADAIAAIEYRLAFKKALRLTMEVAEREIFIDFKEL